MPNTIRIKGDKMVKLTIKLLLFSLSLYLLTGCVSSGKYQNIPDGADLTISTPERTILDRESVPAETKMVCAALINVLRNREETPFVRFFAAAREKVLKEDFDYEEFDVARIDFTDIITRKSGVDQTEGLVEGILHFQDFIGRKTSLYFMAEYMGSPYGIAINNAGVVQLPPHFPEVEAFFVPLEAFNKKPPAFQSYGELYVFAVKNGIGMEPSETEKKSFHAYQKLSYWDKKKAKQKQEKMVVMVFCKDRLKDSSRFEVAASQGEIKPGYLDKNGWPIALYAANFVPDSWDKTFEIMAFYVPEENTQRYVVGKFTNRKSYGPE
jgi:hypothetical protein